MHTQKSGLISIVAPMHNESKNIELFYKRVSSIMENLPFNFEIICINDGSNDDTLFKLKSLHEMDLRIKVIDLSRNYGKEIALSAGLKASRGDAIIPIDADLQDPPELIPKLIEKWVQGFDVVYATRLKREGETFAKKFTAHLFYRFIARITKVNIPADTGDFRLMSKRVVDALNQLPEHHRFMKGLFGWVGFKSTSISYLREPRFAGKSSFNYWKLWNFAIEGITSFSIFPLQIATYFGFFVAFASIIFAVYRLVDTLLFGNSVPGYPSLMVTILFFGGVQLMTLGVIGEYIGRIYNESKRRPLYFIQESLGLDEEANGRHKEIENGEREKIVTFR